MVPLSFDDPVFANVTNMGSNGNLPAGTVLSDKSIVANGQPASIGSGSFTLNRVRIRSSEAIRAGGGDVTLNWVWAEAQASPGDHADGLQCYGSLGLVTVNNTTFRAYSDNTTAGYYASDGWRGTHRLNNVLFWGGPIGLRLDINGGAGVYLKNVFFMKDSFEFRPFQIAIPILQWQNVRYVSIVNGQLVMGEAIPQPQ